MHKIMEKSTLPGYGYLRSGLVVFVFYPDPSLSDVTPSFYKQCARKF